MTIYLLFSWDSMASSMGSYEFHAAFARLEDATKERDRLNACYAAQGGAYTPNAKVVTTDLHMPESLR